MGLEGTVVVIEVGHAVVDSNEAIALHDPHEMDVLSDEHVHEWHAVHDERCNKQGYHLF